MKLRSLIVLVVCASPAYGQNPAPGPTPDQSAEIGKRLRLLEESIATVGKQGVDPDLLSDVGVYAKAVEWITRHGEFQHRDSVKWTLAALDRGLLRVGQAGRGETPWLFQSGTSVSRGFRSRIDGSIQPYAVTFPKGYSKPARGKEWRLDVVLHGRDGTLTEAKFLAAHDGSSEAPEDQDYVMLEIYGRGNVAYRWAGETDVFEAIEHFLGVESKLGRADWLDPNRVVLRGFSMGGAGAWHIGLHHPDRWAVIGPGAGFSTTRGYVRNLPDPLPEHQEKCLRIYDAVEYAENVANVPVVAYSGGEDNQIRAARNIEERLAGSNLSIELLVAPGLEHKFPPEWQRKAEERYQAYAGQGKGREPYPARVRFVTHTLKYPSCDWVEILGMGRHYEPARVDAARIDGTLQVRTENVTALRLGMPPGELFPEVVTIDGQEVSTRYFAESWAKRVHFVRSDRGWEAILGQLWVAELLRQPRKVHGLQGPIDDAFTKPFVCVRGTGTAWNPDLTAATDARLERFRAEWDRFLRGEIAVKDDTEVTDADIASFNLVLFGDPGSNAMIAQILDRLPLDWSREILRLDGAEFDPATHYPALIFPNPLNPTRYVVINSGHTFHSPDFQGTNALLYPRLGDYAVLKAVPTRDDPAAVEVLHAGLFDEKWELTKRD